MINEKNNKIQLIYNSDKLFNSKHLNETIDDIKNYIFNSKFYSSYIKYKLDNINKYETDKSDLISDDWEFCVFICKFINSKEPLSNIVFILERFLYNHRYQRKFDSDPKYLKLTINKVIDLCMKNSTIGSLRPSKEVYNVVYEQSRSNIKSINKNDIIKVCNIFCPFFLEKTNLNRINDFVVYENSTNSQNTIKVEMLGGILNSFDLYVFLCVLRQYKQDYDGIDYDMRQFTGTFKEDFHIFELTMSSLIKSCQSRNSGNISKRILASLNKLSKTHIEVYKNYKQPRYNQDSINNNTNNISYSFNGNLLSFKMIQVKRSMYLKMYLSMPLFRIFQADQYYALINWQSLISLPNYHLRHLYFYFCLNVKVSHYFTEFTINDLIKKLFNSSPNSNVHLRKRRQLLRRLCQFFYHNQELFQDFDFKLSSDYSKKKFDSIKVRRSKFFLN